MWQALVPVEKEHLAYFWTPRGECLKQIKLRLREDVPEDVLDFTIKPMVKCKDRQIQIFHQTKEKDGYLIWQLSYKWQVDCTPRSSGIFKDTFSTFVPPSSFYCVLASEKTIYFYTLEGKLVCDWNFVPDPLTSEHVRVAVSQDDVYILTPRLLRVYSFEGKLKQILSNKEFQYWTHFRVHLNLVLIYEQNNKLLFGIDRFRFFGKRVFEIRTDGSVFICPSGKRLFLAKDQFQSVQVYTFERE